MVDGETGDWETGGLGASDVYANSVPNLKITLPTVATLFDFPLMMGAQTIISYQFSAWRAKPSGNPTNAHPQFSILNSFHTLFFLSFEIATAGSTEFGI